MKFVHGTFNGTGLDMYLCLGFVPDWFWYTDLTTGSTAVGNWYAWSEKFAVVTTAQEGIGNDGSDSSAGVDYGLAGGITAYYGGGIATSTIQSATANGEAPVLVWDHKDYRYGQNSTGAHGAGDADSADIISWTLGSSTNMTGNFNEDVKASATFIGAGSPIIIGGVKYYMTVTLSGSGEAANEATLNRAAPTGDVTFIGNRYSLKPITVGEVMPAGIRLDSACVPATNDNIGYFWAGQFAGPV